MDETNGDAAQEEQGPVEAAIAARLRGIATTSNLGLRSIVDGTLNARDLDV